MKFFNPDNIKKVQLFTAPSGFRYGLIENIFYENVFDQLVKTFPDVKKFKFVDKPSGGGRKRFYVGPVYDANKHQGCICHFDDLDPIWLNVVHESASAELINLFQEVSGIKCNNVAVFGFTYGKEGCVQEPHVDGAVREDRSNAFSTIATLIYFNKDLNGKSGTCVYAPDRQTKLYQVQNMRNTLFFFEQHPDAWHGFPLMPAGEERRLVSLAYGQESQPSILKNSLTHKLTCKLRYKSLAKKLLSI